VTEPYYKGATTWTIPLREIVALIALWRCLKNYSLADQDAIDFTTRKAVKITNSFLEALGEGEDKSRGAP
jgi:uroporphyrinogen-III synthase